MKTVARPYAKAIYGLASDKDQHAAWEQWLESLKALVDHRPFLEQLMHPKVSKEAQVEALMKWVGAKDAGALKRLLALLAQRRRLAVLPAICEQFQALLAQQHAREHVHVVSAFALSDGLKEQLTAWLAKKWQVENIQADFSVDPALIGGVEISTQDGGRVLRLSLHHQLNQLKQTLLGA